jgi:hypothetical protein
MIVIIGLLGGLLGFFGVVLFWKGRKVLGSASVIAGVGLTILCAVALLSFHP